MPFSYFHLGLSFLALLLAPCTALPSHNKGELSIHSCYVSAETICYRQIEENGRQIDAIHNPEHYKPLMEISTPEEFEQAWLRKRDYILANLSHAAYLDPVELGAMIRRFNGRLQFFDAYGRQGYLALWPERAVLVFRGTQGSEIQDVVDDLRADLVTFKGVRVHRGFRDATIGLWNDQQIRTHLEDASEELRDSSEIYVTGHSLGAAMAVIAAMMYPFKALVTFGQPRVGDDILSEIKAPSTYRRVVNGNDNITLLPPDAWGYQHRGQLVKISDPQGSAELIGLTLINADHSIVNYGRILWSLEN